MRLVTLLAFSLLLAPAGASKSAHAQKKKPAQAKPPVSRGTRGTTQLAGDNGKMNVAYTIGATTPVNITLTGAEFTVSRVNMGEYTYFPGADEKLLVLKYTIQNPNSAETQYDWSTLKFTAVSQDNVNREYVQNIAKQGNNESVNLALKPAQKLDVFAVIVVPAKGTVPKLMVEHHTGGPVLRYDLKGQIKPLAAPFADPEDKSGITARAEVPAALNTFLPLGRFDARYEAATYAGSPLGEIEAEEGKRFFVATIRFKNAASASSNYDASVISAVLETSDDEKIEAGDMLKAKSYERATGELAANAEYTVRYYFQIPGDVTAKTLRLVENGDKTTHALVFDVSAAKPSE